MVYDPGLTGDKQQLINKTVTILPILLALHGRSLVKSVRLWAGLVYVSHPFTCCLLACGIFFSHGGIEKLWKLPYKFYNFYSWAPSSEELPTTVCVTTLKKFLLLNKLFYRQPEVFISASLLATENSILFNGIFELMCWSHIELLIKMFLLVFLLEKRAFKDFQMTVVRHKRNDIFSFNSTQPTKAIIRHLHSQRRFSQLVVYIEVCFEGFV